MDDLEQENARPGVAGHGGRCPVAERQHERDSEDERNGEGERAERERRSPVCLELVEVELETCEEHQEEDPELAERLDHTVPLDSAESERPDEEPAEDDADDARQTDPLDEERPQQDHGRRDEERPLRGRRRELDRERHRAIF